MSPTTTPRPQFLYVAHRVPYPPDKGDRIRNWNVLRWLSRHADVDLACLADEPVAPEHRAVLEQTCRRLAIVPQGRWSRHASAATALAMGQPASVGAFASRALRRTITDWCRQIPYDAALASASSVAPYLQPFARRGSRVIVDLVDLDSEKWRQYAADNQGPRAWLHHIEARRLRHLEQTLASWASALVLVSRDEAALYHQHVGPGPVVAIPNGVDLDYFQPQPPAPEGGLVFVGALDYRPNVDGVLGFARQVWPGLQARCPGVSLRLVGRRPVAALKRLAATTPGIELVGQVPDVRPHVARAAVVIAPLQIARGIQNKVLEALAMGKAVVASPEACTGLEVAPGLHLELATTPAEWVDTLTTLLADPTQRAALGTAGRAYVETHHDWEECLRPFGAAVGLVPPVLTPALRSCTDRTLEALVQS